MSKYEPIEKHLAALKENNITLTYAQMEELATFKLPDSAYKHRAWWSNGKKGGSKFWLRVNWLVDAVKLGESVSFRRGEEKARPRKKAKETVEVGDLFEIMMSLDIADIPGIIKDLQALMVEGLITADEFEEKRIRLLALL